MRALAHVSADVLTMTGLALTGVASAFTPDYAPEEMFEVAQKLYKMSR